MKKKWKIIRTIVTVIASALFLISAYMLCTTFWEYKKGEDEYTRIVKTVIRQKPEKDEKGNEESGFEVDFDALKKSNEDTVAWIRFENPSQINYPVLRADNNEKYLKTTFEGNRNAAGAIFMDFENAGDFTDSNTYIYGHNMKNGSMFGKLRQYKQKSFYEENPCFYIYTPEGAEYKYQIFAVTVIEDSPEYYRKIFADEQDFGAYLKQVQKKSLYDTGVAVTERSKVVALSTCTNVTKTQRLIVHGVKIEERIVGE